jgi:hypothetical protein
MVTHATTNSLADLYEADETAWLDTTAQLLAEGRLAEVDTENLIEYLTSMARRDRRELTSRLIVLLVHLLKWVYQPEKRTTSWALTIIEQQSEVEFDVQSRTLRRHANEVLQDTYLKACRTAAAETGLDSKTFSDKCPWSLHDVLAYKPEE